MIYAHYDIRYIAYAFPETYAHYARQARDIIGFDDLRVGWSFTGSVFVPSQKLEKLQKYMWKEIERIQSFDLKT